MKFVTSRYTLLQAIEIAGRSTGNKVMPIFDNFLVDIRDNELIITGSNLEVSTTTRTSIEPCGFSHKVAIPVDILSDIIKKLPEAPIEFTLNKDNNIVFIHAGRGEYNISGEDGGVFPIVVCNGDKSFKMNAADFKAGIAKTLFAVGVDELRPAMTGVQLAITSDEVTFTATDGHKISSTSIQCKPGIIASLIIPERAMKILGTATMNEEIKISVDKDKIAVSIDESTIIYSRLIDGQYPNWEAVIPVDQDTVLEIDRKEMIGAVNRASVFENKTSNAISLSMTDGLLTVRADDVDFGRGAKEELPCSVEGPEMEICFNSKYLLAILNRFSGDTIYMSLTTPNRAAVLRDYPGGQSKRKNFILIMPVQPTILQK